MYLLYLIIVPLYVISTRYLLRRSETQWGKNVVRAILILTWAPLLLVIAVILTFPALKSTPIFQWSGRFGESAVPLILMLLIPLSAFGMAMTRWINNPKARASGLVLVVVLGYAILFGDEVAGQFYLRRLCANEAGIRVYQTVELPPEYWSEDGSPKFYQPNGNFHLDGFGVKHSTETYSPQFHVDMRKYTRFNERTGQPLGERVDFIFWGGWLRRNAGAHNGATSCKNRNELSDALIRQTFIRKP